MSQTSQEQTTEVKPAMVFKNPDGDATYKQHGKLGTLVMEKLTNKSRENITMGEASETIASLKEKLGESNEFQMRCKTTATVSYKTLAFIGKLYAQTKKLATIKSVSDEIAKFSN